MVLPTKTIPELDPVVTLLPAALIEISQGVESFSATIQQVINLAAGGGGVTSINADITAAQLLAGTAGRISLVDAGALHTFDIDSAYVGQATIITLGTITTGVWNATAITYANLSFSADIVNTDISLTAAIATSKLADSTNFVLINQANVFGDFNQTFKDNRILIESPDGLTPTTIVNAQQTLARNLTIPILTGNRSIVVTTEASQITLGTEVTGASTDLTDTAVIARSTDNLSFFAATTSLQLLGVISDETGSGLLVFGTTPTIVTPTIASFTNATHDHSNTAGGGTLLSTSALSDTADIAYLNTANIYTGGTRQDFLGLLAGTAGLNVGGIAGNPTTQVNGDIWYNSTSNTLFGRVNGANVDLGVTAGGGDMVLADVQTVTGAKTFGTIGGVVGKFILAGSTSGSTIVNAAAIAGATTVTFQGVTGTLALLGDNLGVFAATTSLQLLGVISDETGSGALVFGTSPTLTTPRFADLGFIADSNGNEMLSFNQVASAVNYVEVANAAIAGELSLSALGGDTNITMRLIPKGTGTIYGNRETWAWPLTDEATLPVVGVTYTTEPSPYDMTIEDSIAGLTVAGTGATLFTIDVLKENSVNANAFTTIFTTKPTIDASEFTSTTAATPQVLNVTTWEKGRRLQLKIDTLDTNTLGRGAKISLICHATAK